MKTLATLLLAALPTTHAWAQATGNDHAAHHPAPAVASAPAAGETTAAEVRRIDKAAKKITLKHEHIKNLDMAPMTMVFQVRDAALLDKVQPGDAVRFTADKVDGAYVLLSIDPVKN